MSDDQETGSLFEPVNPYAGSGPYRPQARQPQARRPEPRRPEVTQPEVARPEAARPEAARPEVPTEPAPPRPPSTGPLPTRRSMRGKPPIPQTRPTPVVPPSVPAPQEQAAQEQAAQARLEAELAAHRAAYDPGRRPAAETQALPPVRPALPPVRPAQRPVAPAPVLPVPVARPAVNPLIALPALAVVLIGFGLVVLGGLKATVLAPAPTVVATLDNGSQVPVLLTAPGLLGLEGTRTGIVARGRAASETVFIGIGRAADVEAYLGRTSRMELTGHNEQGQVLTRLAPGQATVPDPASADVWVASVRAKGAVTLAWPTTPGRWRVLVAADGSRPAPADVTVTWSGKEGSSAPPVLIAIGVVMMVGAGVTLVMISSRAAAGPGDRSSPAPARGTDYGQGARL